MQAQLAGLCLTLGLLGCSTLSAKPQAINAHGTAFALTHELEPPGAGPLEQRPTGQELVIVEVVLDDRVMDDAFTVLQGPDDVWVPLGALAQLLQVSLQLDVHQGRAISPLMDDTRTVTIDTRQQRVSVGEHTMPLNARQAQWLEGELYVATQSLARWWPLSFDMNGAHLRLTLRTKVPFPVQSRWAREKLMGIVTPQSSAKTFSDWPNHEAPKALWRLPTIEQTFGAEARGTWSHSHCTPAYQAHAVGEWLGMQASMNFNVKTSGRTQARWTLEQHDAAGGLLGPLGATHAALTYRNTASQRWLSAGGALATGLTVSNRPLSLPDSFDRHTLRGDLPQGWDVTLYQNDALVGFRSSNVSGQYQFEDLPLAFGPNEFKLVFNGPLGQMRVERQTLTQDQNSLQPGEWRYQASAHRLRQGGEQWSGMLEKGLTPHWVARTGGWFSTSTNALPYTNTTPRAAARFFQAGLRHQGRQAIVQQDVIRSTEGGLLSVTTATTRWRHTSVSVEHLARSRQFASEVLPDGPQGLKRRTTLQAQRTISFSGLPSLTLGGEAQVAQLTDGQDQHGLTGRLATSVHGTAVAWQVRHAQQGPYGPEVSSSLRLNRRMLGWGVTAQLDLGKQVNSRAQRVSLAADRTLADGFRLAGALQYLPLERLGALSMSLSKRLGALAVAFSANVQSQGHFQAGLQLFSTLQHDPRTNEWSATSRPQAQSGAVSVRAFLDTNLNGQFDLGETVLPQLALRLHENATAPGRTDDQGVLRVDGLSPHLPVALSIDPNALEDPQWRAEPPGVRVTPRTGVTLIVDLPVIQTSEVEGTVLLATLATTTSLGTASTRSGAGRVRLELVAPDTHQVLAKTETSGDGYFLFHQVRPGPVILRVDPEQVRQRSLSGEVQKQLQVPSGGDFMSDVNLVLHRSAAAQQKP
jgi:hypothetical protein